MSGSCNLLHCVVNLGFFPLPSMMGCYHFVTSCLLMKEFLGILLNLVAKLVSIFFF